MRLPGFIEVELGSFCNRRCGWCPNAFSERGQTRNEMKDSTWAALLDSLSAARFAGWFAFHNYNEPLADPRLLERVADARERLPHAKLELHTNGDFLDRLMLDALAGLGVELVQRRFETEAAFEGAWQAYQVARSQVQAIEGGVLARARQVLAIAEAAYRLGERGILEYLDAQRQFRLVRNDLIAARFDLQRARTELERLAGR